jgi:hypothetical protein
MTCVLILWRLAGRFGEATIFIAIFPLLFVGIWLLVMFVLSRASGWSSLANSYPSNEPFSGTVEHWQSAQMRATSHYNGCLNFGANAHGLYLVPMLLFRSFHPALSIPWSEVTSSPVKMWLFFDYIELRFARVPGVFIRIRPTLAAKLVENSGGIFRVEAKAMAAF